jgi:type IV pilus assembly protein PilE
MHQLTTRAGQHAGSSGFTLIEVMVTVAIVAILAAIALPSYNDYVTRSRLTEGASALSDLRVRMEQFYQDHRAYGTGTSCGLDGASNQIIVFPLPGLSYFTVSCALTNTAQAYEIRAEGTGPLAGFVYLINQSNQRSTGGVPQGWTTPNPNTCWVSRRSGSC